MLHNHYKKFGGRGCFDRACFENYYVTYNLFNNNFWGAFFAITDHVKDIGKTKHLRNKALA